MYHRHPKAMDLFTSWSYEHHNPQVRATVRSPPASAMSEEQLSYFTQKSSMPPKNSTGSFCRVGDSSNVFFFALILSGASLKVHDNVYKSIYHVYTICKIYIITIYIYIYRQIFREKVLSISHISTKLLWILPIGLWCEWLHWDEGCIHCAWYGILYSFPIRPKSSHRSA